MMWIVFQRHCHIFHRSKIAPGVRNQSDGKQQTCWSTRLCELNQNPTKNPENGKPLLVWRNRFPLLTGPTNRMPLWARLL